MTMGAGVRDGVDGAIFEHARIKKVINKYVLSWVYSYLRQLKLVNKDWSRRTMADTLLDFKLAIRWTQRID